MRHKLALATIVTVAVSVISTAPALGQAYRWKDSNGRTVISDTPPPQTPDTRQLKTVPLEAAGEGGKGYQEKNKEFRERTDARRTKEQKESQDALLKEGCERYRGALIALTSGQRLSMLNSKGEPQPMDDAEREREVARTREFIEKNCK